MDREERRRVYRLMRDEAQKQADQLLWEVGYWERALQRLDQLDLEVDRVVKVSAPPSTDRLPPAPDRV